MNPSLSSALLQICCLLSGLRHQGFAEVYSEGEEPRNRWLHPQQASLCVGVAQLSQVSESILLQCLLLGDGLLPWNAILHNQKESTKNLRVSSKNFLFMQKSRFFLLIFCSFDTYTFSEISVHSRAASQVRVGILPSLPSKASYVTTLRKGLFSALIKFKDWSKSALQFHPPFCCFGGWIQ